MSMKAPVNHLDGLPHLRVIEDLVYLPKVAEASTQNFDICMFLVVPHFDSAVAMMNIKNIKRNNRMRRYYYQTLYQGNLFRRYVRYNDISGRIQRYEAVKKDVNEFVRGTLEPMDKRDNIYIDLSKWHDIFIEHAKHSSSFMLKAETYIDCLKDWMNGPFSKGYKKQLMLIDIRAWEKEFIVNGKITNITNPVAMIYYLMRRNFKKFQELGNIDIIFVSDNKLIRINPTECTESSYNLLRTRLMMLYRSIDWSDDQLDELVDDTDQVTRVKNMVSLAYNLTGTVDKYGDKRREKIEEVVDKNVDKITKNKVKKSSTSNKNEMTEEDFKIIDTISEEINKEIAEDNPVGKNPAMLKRDKMLRERQRNIKIVRDGKDFYPEEVVSNMKEDSLAVRDISGTVATTNTNMHKVRYPSFDTSYEKQLYSDIFGITSILNKAEIPMYLVNASIEDSSDLFTKKDTVKMVFEDTNRVRHSVTVDVPKLIEGKFIEVSGNRKVINKQQLMLPIVKIKEDLVQVATNYNKVMVTRYGTVLSARTVKIRKAIAESNTRFQLGNNLAANGKYLTTMEYDELSKYYNFIAIKGGSLNFSQKKVHEKLTTLNIKVPDDMMVVGFRGNAPIMMSLETHRIIEDGKNKDLVDLILEGNSKLQELYDSSSAGKRFLFTRARIMAKDVPLILLTAYNVGLTEVLRRVEVDFEFTDKRPKADDDYTIVQFEDGYLRYNHTNIEHALLLNGLSVVPTRTMSIGDIDKREPYHDIFDVMYNQRNISSAFDNFYDFMVDNITFRVLEDHDLPTDWTDILLYSNKLLTTNAYTPEGDLSLYRVRSTEIVPVYLYKALTTAYGNYRRTHMYNNPQKMTIPKDAVLKELLTAQTVEDYGVLNPIVEIEKTRTISPKGPSGLNLSRAYTIDKRAYHPSMLGTIGMSTSPDANAGVSRVLSLEPNIINARGYIDTNTNIEDLKDVNIFTPAELMTPLGATRDDPSRTAMAVKQAKHVVPVHGASPVLISNGMEQVVHQYISSDFAFTAKQDGKVTSINEEQGVAIVTYKDKTTDIIDIRDRIMKNSAGGFYLDNKLVMRFKEGQSFKAHEVLAAERAFFTETVDEGSKFNIGSLQKVAIMGGYWTYEDSTAITKKLSEDMAVDMVEGRDIVLSATDNISDLVKVGDFIQVGDPLLNYESSSGDEAIGELLKNVGDALKEDVSNLSRRPIKSKFTGEVIDIKVYSDVELDEMSPSLRKLASSYYKKNKERIKYVNGMTDSNNDLLFNEPTGKVVPPDGKLKGNIMDRSVLIQIFIRYTDVMSTGDKMAHFTALKATVGKVIPEGYEPYTLNEPDEEISTFIGPAAVAARMTPSILLTIMANKVLINLKRRVNEINEEK